MEESKKLRARPGVSLPAPKTPVSTAADDDPTGGGTAALIVMCAVLTIIVLFCCFAAPGIRDLCKRYIFKSCIVDDPEANNGIPSGESVASIGTPTVILLPYGRMLVVDRSVFTRLRADHSGIDFMDLVRGHHYLGSTPSMLDSPSKGSASPSNPPTYEDLFGDLPPSYSEVSLMLARTGKGRHAYGISSSRDDIGGCKESTTGSRLSMEDIELLRIEGRYGECNKLSMSQSSVEDIELSRIECRNDGVVDTGGHHQCDGKSNECESVAGEQQESVECDVIIEGIGAGDCYYEREGECSTGEIAGSIFGGDLVSNPSSAHTLQRSCYSSYSLQESSL